MKIINFIIFLLFIGGSAQASGQWQLVAEKSRIDFIGKSTLHDFNGKARRITGAFEQNKNLVKGFIGVDIAGLTTDEPRRDKNMYQMFDVSRYPQINFVFNDADIARILDHHDGEIKFTGIMTIHGISHPVTLVSKGSMDEDTLSCEGEMLIHLKDYGLKAPSILGLIRVSDEVAVEYNIVFIHR